MFAASDFSEPGHESPRAAAFAGLIFSVLLILGLVIVRLAAQGEGSREDIWMSDPPRRSMLVFAFNLIPFAGIAFLWFMGELLNRLGARNNLFSATVFLGAGLLFVASLFAATAVADGLAQAIATGHLTPPESEAYNLARRLSYTFLNVFAIKMAGAFTFITCTIALRTGVLPRWVAFSGFACGLVLLLAITNWPWIALLFPLWILQVSACILGAGFSRRNEKAACGRHFSRQGIG
jgi:hypothetical protein